MAEYDKEMYDRFCGPTFTVLFKKLDDAEEERKEDRKAILDNLNEMNKRMYIDNGSKCFQSRLNQQELWIKRVCAVLTLLFVPMVLIIFRSLWVFIMDLLKNS